jgi:hypothetical protein
MTVLRMDQLFYRITDFKKHIFITGFLFLYFLQSNPSLGQNFWTLQTSSGDAYCLPASLTIKQSGYKNIGFQAEYHTYSLRMPFYYSLKVARWNQKSGWEVELIHLKLFLKNKPATVEKFDISHGYNFLIINRGWMFPYLIFHAGVGIVIGHPENIIRGNSLSENKGILKSGYYIVGPALQLDGEQRIKLNQNFFFSLEMKITAAFSRIPLSGGHANLQHLAVHGLVGLGYQF